MDIMTKCCETQRKVQDLPVSYQRQVSDCKHRRRKTQRCVEGAKVFGIQSFCKDLEEVAGILKKTAECNSEETESRDQSLNLEVI